MRDEPPSRSLSGGGKFRWHAFRPDGGGFEEDDDDPWIPPPSGSVIRLMGDHGAEIPLWDHHGLMFTTVDELIAELGVSPGLAADLATWGIGWERRSGQPDHDAEAAGLVRRLNGELDGRYQFVYRP